MIKWENPMLISLTGTDTQGDTIEQCDPGSGNPGTCYTGYSAIIKCFTVGNAAIGDCYDGNSPAGYCGAGNTQ